MPDHGGGRQWMVGEPGGRPSLEDELRYYLQTGKFLPPGRGQRRTPIYEAPALSPEERDARIEEALRADPLGRIALAARDAGLPGSVLGSGPTGPSAWPPPTPGERGGDLGVTVDPENRYLADLAARAGSQAGEDISQVRRGFAALRGDIAQEPGGRYDLPGIPTEDPGVPGTFSQAAAAGQSGMSLPEMGLSWRDQVNPAARANSPATGEYRTQIVGNRLLEFEFDPATGRERIVGEQDLRDPEDVALARAYQRAQIARMQGAGGGRTQFASEADLQRAQADLYRAQAGDIAARQRLQEAGLTGMLGEQQTLAGRELDAQIENQANQYKIQLQRLGMDERQAQQQADQFAQTLALQRDQFGLQRDIGLGNLDIARGDQALRRELGLGGMDIQRGQLDLQRELGLGRLDLDTRALANQTQQTAAERALREGMALGRIGGEQTLEAQLGLGNLDIARSRAALEQAIQMGQLANQTAGLYGFGSQGRTLDAQRLAGVLTGGDRTLENIFGRADRSGVLDGQETLAGRQQREAEQMAAFQRATTPGMAGALAGLAARGLIDPSAVQSGDLSTLRAGGLAQRGGVGAVPQPGQMRAAVMPQAQGQGMPAPAAQPAQPLNYSLQQLKPLNTRQTQALGGYAGAFGQSLQDIGEQAQQEMNALGGGLQRRARTRLGLAA